jgi:hypothetical protein
MRKYSILFALLAAVALSLVPLRQAQAQVATSTLRGVVTDQTGAVIPGGTVTVRNPNTGVTQVATTSADGAYQFTALLPGTYNVTIEKSGFKRFVSGSTPLRVGKTYVLNAVLSVGTTATEVAVHATANQINTTSMQLGTTVTGQTIQDLPLIGRNWVNLQQLEPGVMASSDRFGTFSTDGAETQQNNYMINGLSTTEIELNDIEVHPSLDAVGEFTLVDSTSNPEYARNSGASLNAIIKSGTNAFHGDAFDFYRETSLNSRNFFQATTAPYHQNQFGATLGGPVRKDHTFFFFSYEGSRQTTPEFFSVPTVFTPAERSGTWPGLATSTGSSAFPLVGDNGASYPAGTPYSTIFSGGTIPSADLSPLAVKLMDQYVPLPNAAANTYTFTPSDVSTVDQYVTRIDENFSPKDTLWGYWLWERAPDTETLPFGGSTLPGFSETDGNHAQEYELEWNHIFTPTLINSASFGYYRHNFQAVEPTDPINPTAYGFTGLLPQTLEGASLPVISLTGFFSIGFSIDGPQPRIVNQYQPADDLTWIHGRHTLKFGFNMQRFEDFNPFYSRLSGTYSYGGIGKFTTGLPGADFLLGVPDSYFQTAGGINNGRSREYYSYAQDQFKVKPNLTVTYGVGWDIETPYYNLYANGLAVAAFRPGVQSTVFPTAPEGLLYPGDPGINSAGGPTTHYHDFGPRVGFAYAPASAKWSLHAGFGIYYDRTEEELALQNLGVPPTGQSSFGAGDLGGSPAFATPFSGWCPVKGGAPVPCSETNKFPFTPPPAGDRNVNFAEFEPMSLNLLSPNFRSPYSQNYNMTLEYQISPSTTASLAYVGNVGRHLEGAYELNPGGTFPGVNPTALADGCGPSNLIFCAPQTFSYANPTVFGALDEQDTDYNSDFNSLQFNLTKNFSHGLYLNASYTWSHYMDQTSSLENSAFNAPGVNPFDFESMWANSANDAPQRLVISYDYVLPFYHFVPHLRQLTDGWHITGITTFQSGFPISVFDSAAPSLTCGENEFYSCWDRANLSGTPIVIGNPRTYSFGGSPNYWVNPSAFAKPALGTGGIGDASRNPFFGPGLNNWDITLYKDIHISESKYFQLRFETYNTFNQTQFLGETTNQLGTGGVVSDINNPLFGRIIAANDPRFIQLAAKFYF